MRRLLALLLVLGAAYLVNAVGGGRGSDARGTALALGVALIAAALAGDLFERIRLPRITGYLVFGLVCGPYILNIITRPMARELQLVNGLAIALIAFMAGLELNFARLRPRLVSILTVGAVTLGLMYASLSMLLWIAWPWLPLAPEVTGAARAALAVLLTAVIVSFSPTVTIAVITDSRARGELSELVLALVILADLALIFFFTLAMQFVRWALGEAPPGDISLLVRLSWEILGSLTLGAVFGAVFAFYLRGIGRELTVVLLAFCAAVGQVSGMLHVEPLLTALAAGLVVENVAPPEGDALRRAVERGALPVLVVFFAAAGTSLHLDALASVGLMALVISLVRAGLAWTGVRLGTRVAGVESQAGRLAWTGLVSQAGVTLGLTIIVATEFPEWGLQVQTLMVALIALHELAGPVLFRAALTRAGEVGRMHEGAVDARTAAGGLVHRAATHS